MEIPIRAAAAGNTFEQLLARQYPGVLAREPMSGTPQPRLIRYRLGRHLLSVLTVGGPTGAGRRPSTSSVTSNSSTTGNGGGVNRRAPAKTAQPGVAAKKPSTIVGDTFTGTAIYRGGAAIGNDAGSAPRASTNMHAVTAAESQRENEIAEREAADFLQLERFAYEGTGIAQPSSSSLLPTTSTTTTVATTTTTTTRAATAIVGREPAVVWRDESPPPPSSSSSSSARITSHASDTARSQVSGGVASAAAASQRGRESKTGLMGGTGGGHIGGAGVPTAAAAVRFEDESEWEDLPDEQSDYEQASNTRRVTAPVIAAPAKKRLGPAPPPPSSQQAQPRAVAVTGQPGVGKMQHSPIRPSHAPSSNVSPTAASSLASAGPPRQRTQPPQTAPSRISSASILDDDETENHTDDGEDDTLHYHQQHQPPPQQRRPVTTNGTRSNNNNNGAPPATNHGGLFPRSNQQYSLSDHDRPSEPPGAAPRTQAAKARAARDAAIAAANGGKSGSNKGSSAPNSPPRRAGSGPTVAASAIPKPKNGSLKGSVPSVAKKSTASSAAAKKAASGGAPPPAISSAPMAASASSTALIASGDSERIAELENHLRRLTREQEHELKFIRQEAARAKKQLADSEAEFKAYKLKEGKKLKKEREELEKQTKRVLALPDRKEREALELVKEELAASRRELKQKESRWKTEQQRLNGQVAQLQMDNRQLREEIKIAEDARLKEWEEKEKKWKVTIEDKVRRDIAKKDIKRRELAADIDARMGRTIMADEGDDQSAPLMLEDHHQRSQYVATQTTQHVADGAGSPREELYDDDEDEAEFDLGEDDHTRQQHVTGILRSSNGRMAASSSSRPATATGAGAARPSQPAARPLSASHGATAGALHGRPTDDTMAAIRVERHLPRVSPKKEHPSTQHHHTTGALDMHMPSSARTNNHDTAVEMVDGVRVVEEVTHSGGKIEKKLADGSRMIIFRNGTLRRTYDDGRVAVHFNNGDRKEVWQDKKVVYFYAQNNTTHTTLPDGVQIYHFGDEQTEHHYPDGRKHIKFADGTEKEMTIDGVETTIFPDGSRQTTSSSSAATTTKTTTTTSTAATAAASRAPSSGLPSFASHGAYDDDM